MSPQQQKTQFPSLTTPPYEQRQFNKNYHELVTGINRIRYIKKKQQHNHNMMHEHLTNILQQIQKQQHNHSTPKLHVYPPKNNPQLVQFSQKFKYNLEEYSPYKPHHSSQSYLGKLNSQIRSQKSRNFTNLPNKENDNRPTFSQGSQTISNPTDSKPQSKPQSRQEQKRMIFQKKQQNYHQMRQLRLRREDRQKQIHQQKLNAARSRRLRVICSREEGKRRIEQQYYKHIDTIKAEKETQKEQKTRLNEKKYNQLLDVQKQEEQELALFERSILMEDELKSFIQRGSHNAKLHEVMVTNDTFL